MRRSKYTLLSVSLLLGGLFAADAPARKLLEHPDPEYSPVAAKLSLHGTVRLRVWITPEGSVRKVEYIGGHPLLAESAIKAVKNWKFQPATSETTEILEIKF